MGIAIGSVAGGIYSGPATGTSGSGPGRHSVAPSAADDFKGLLDQSGRLRAQKYAQTGLKDQDRQPLDPQHRQLENKVHDKMREAAAHAADPSRLGLVADIKV